MLVPVRLPKSEQETIYSVHRIEGWNEDESRAVIDGVSTHKTSTLEEAERWVRENMTEEYIILRVTAVSHSIIVTN